MIGTALNPNTFLPKKNSIQRAWHLVDAKGQILGRFATQVANLLTGKGKIIYTHSIDCGDFVVAVNVEQIQLTGKKLEQKIAFHHTGHPGGARFVPYKKLARENPERMLYLAVKRMLPKNKLASRQILRLKIYRGAAHPHAAQKAAPFSLAPMNRSAAVASSSA